MNESGIEKITIHHNIQIGGWVAMILAGVGAFALWGWPAALIAIAAVMTFYDEKRQRG